MSEPERGESKGKKARRRWQLRRRSWLVVGAGLGLLLVAFELRPLSVAEITFDVVASGIAFTLTERQPLTAPRQNLTLSAFEAGGLRTVRFPRLRDASVLSEAARQGPGLLRLATTDATSSLTLDAPVPRAGHRLRLTALDGGGCRFEVECSSASGEEGCGDLDLQVNLQGAFSVTMPDVTPPVVAQPLELRTPRAVALETALEDQPVFEVFTAEPSAGAGWFSGSARGVTTAPILAWQVKVGEISFEDVETLEMVDARPVVRTYSTLHGGELRFSSLPGRSHEVLPGERIAFEEVDGTLHSVRLEGDALRVVFGGKVGTVTTGADGRSLKPSRLEAHFARESFRFTVGLIASLMMIAFGLQRMIEIEF